LYRCADQARLGRYESARLIRDRLERQLTRVRAACSPHERGLFKMLLAELEGYAMALQALLLCSKKFQLGDPGELQINPGFRTCCENRRLAIRSLAGRLLHPLDSPRREADVRFMAAETNEERKMIVHRGEGEIRREREVTFDKASKGSETSASWTEPLEKLMGNRKPTTFRESSWDLDRIYYYLLIQYFGTRALRWEPAAEPTAVSPNHKGVHLGVLNGPAAGTHDPLVPMKHDWLCAARDVEMEMERYRAKSKGAHSCP
jgi:hypothetical protein